MSAQDPLNALFNDDEVDTFSEQLLKKPVYEDDTAALLKEADKLASKVESKSLFEGKKNTASSNLFADEEEEVDIEASQEADINKFKTSRTTKSVEASSDYVVSGKSALGGTTAAPAVKKVVIREDELFTEDLDDDIFGATNKYKTKQVKQDVYIPSHAVENRTEADMVSSDLKKEDKDLISSVGDVAEQDQFVQKKLHITEETPVVKPKVKFNASQFAGETTTSLNDDLFGDLDFGESKELQGAVGDDFDFGAYIANEGKGKKSSLFD